MSIPAHRFAVVTTTHPGEPPPSVKRLAFKVGDRLAYAEEDQFAVLVTPQIAEYLLDNMHPLNREPDEQVVALWSRALKSGMWEWVRDIGLAVTKSGLVSNAGHRLVAIKATGIAGWLPMTVGQREDIILYLDRNRPRTNRQGLAIKGAKYPAVAHAISLTAAYDLNAGDTSVWKGGGKAMGKLSQQECDEVWDSDVDGWEHAMEKGTDIQRATSGLTSYYWAAIHRIVADAKGVVEADRFYEAIKGYAQGSSADPVIAQLRTVLFNKGLMQVYGGHTGDRRVVFENAIRAYNAWSAGLPSFSVAKPNSTTPFVLSKVA